MQYVRDTIDSTTEFRIQLYCRDADGDAYFRS